MSKIAETKLGRFRGVTDGQKKWWLWECPDCKRWAPLSADQWEGRASVYCDNPVPSPYDLTPDAVKPCGYHQTHEYAKELVAAVQVRLLFGEEPFTEDRP